VHLCGQIEIIDNQGKSLMVEVGKGFYIRKHNLCHGSTLLPSHWGLLQIMVTFELIFISISILFYEQKSQQRGRRQCEHTFLRPVEDEIALTFLKLFF
jgi:hypothetical protein